MNQLQNTSSFSDFLANRLANTNISPPHNINYNMLNSSSGWMQRVFSGVSLSSGNIGLDIDESSHLSEDSDKTLKSGNKTPKRAVGSHTSKYLSDISGASSLSKRS